mgnify:CR=1 FL=1
MPIHKLLKSHTFLLTPSNKFAKTIHATYFRNQKNNFKNFAKNLRKFRGENVSLNEQLIAIMFELLILFNMIQGVFKKYISLHNKIVCTQY